jgi:hypothetical protein
MSPVHEFERDSKKGIHVSAAAYGNNKNFHQFFPNMVAIVVQGILYRVKKIYMASGINTLVHPFVPPGQMHAAKNSVQNHQQKTHQA